MRLVWCVPLAAAIVLWLSHPHILDHFSYLYVSPASTDMAWHSEFAGWHIRAQMHPTPASFVPSRDSLVLGVLRSEPARPDGFTLALFLPNVAVDASGRVLLLAEADFVGLAALGEKARDLPQTRSFQNIWRVKQSRTSQPIERLFVKDQSDALYQLSVQGYEKGQRELKTPVNEYTELPEMLWELFGLFEEAREGLERGKEDQTTIQKIRDILEEGS